MGKRVLVGSLQPYKSFLMQHMLGAERWKPFACHSTTGSVSALPRDRQRSHQPLNPHVG